MDLYKSFSVAESHFPPFSSSLTGVLFLARKRSLCHSLAWACPALVTDSIKTHHLLTTFLEKRRVYTRILNVTKILVMRISAKNR